MKFARLKYLIVGIGSFATSISIAAYAPPHLVHNLNTTELVVDDQPYLALGGEVRNSSSSNLHFMNDLWPRLATLHLNTVLVPVAWEQLEPAEGSFDFNLVDGLISGARANHLHLVVLWFGTWKNMVSSYAPRWVRADPTRFPLTVDNYGHHLPIPSTFGDETRKADANAFRQLMRHIRQVDGGFQTVIMVQVENEVGLPDSQCDQSSAAQTAFLAPIPSDLADRLKNHPDMLTRELRSEWEQTGGHTSGSWAEVFGRGPIANELFMAWSYARYVNDVAGAGKAEYPIPFFVNAAIGRHDGKVGSYPGGGALPLAFDAWHLAAPNIDILSPDIYFGSFSGWCRGYTQSANPLFIPETRANETAGANSFLAVGNWNALGFSPFAIDDRFPGEAEFSQAYEALAELSPLILGRKDGDSLAAVAVDHDQTEQTVSVGKYRIKVTLRKDRKTAAVADRGYALIVADQPDHFFVAGMDAQVTWMLAEGGTKVVELDRVEDGSFLNGNWEPRRRLNGDEIMLDYDFSELAEKNMTGTGLRFDSEGPTIISVSVFSRAAGAMPIVESTR